jgi:hypothetical protein
MVEPSGNPGDGPSRNARLGPLPLTKEVIIGLLTLASLIAGLALIETRARATRHALTRSVAALTDEIGTNAKALADQRRILSSLQQSTIDLKTEIAAQGARIEAQGKQFEAQRKDIEARRKETEDPFKSDLATSFAFIDNVDIYQKNGLVEVYGGTFIQRRTAPISVSSAMLTPTQEIQWVIWAPDFFPAPDAGFLRVELAPERLDVGTLVVGLAMADKRAFEWTINLGPPSPQRSSPDEAIYTRDEFLQVVQHAVKAPLARVGPNRFEVKLPPEASKMIRALGDRAVRNWYMRYENGVGVPLPIRNIAITNRSDEADDEGASSLIGRVVGASIEPNSTVELTDETGKRVTSVLALDGSFSFANLHAHAPVSLKYRLRQQDIHANHGRWFAPAAGAFAVAIDAAAPFAAVRSADQEGLPAEIVDVKATYPQEEQGLTYYRYLPHRRLLINGKGGIQMSFSNNFGFLDRDREFANRDNWLRIVHVGSSTVQALQVRPFEKFDLLLEAELGVRLGRCVEVISAGRDAGDIGANFRLVRDYGMKFDPALVIIENVNALVLNLQPDLLLRMHGWDPEHNIFDSFAYDPNGKLTFRQWDPNWPLSAIPPAPDKSLDPPLPSGITNYQILYVDREHMHPIGLKLLDTLRDIAIYYQQAFPHTKIALASALDQLECPGDCRNVVTLPDGQTIPRNVRVLVENVRWASREAGIYSIDSPFPTADERGEDYLIPHDGHLSVRGHQWEVQGQIDQIQRILAR